MNPGSAEDEQNACFVGPSGKIVASLYIEAPQLHKLTTIYLTNAARCYTHAKSPPKAKHYATCLPLYTFPDFRVILATHTQHPELLVLTLGADPVKALYKAYTGKEMPVKKAINQQGHQLTHPTLPPLRVFSTYHPAALLRDHSYKYSIVSHLSLLSRYLENSSPVPTKPTVVLPHPPP